MAGDLNALAGTPTGAVTPGGYGTALGQVFRRDFPTYEVGLQLTLPLRIVSPKRCCARRTTSQAGTVRRQQLQDQCVLEVADAEEIFRRRGAAYDAAVEARRLQEQSVSVEQQTFAVGLSTNLVVIQYQGYLATGSLDGGCFQRCLCQGKDCPCSGPSHSLDENHVAIDEAYRAVSIVRRVRCRACQIEARARQVTISPSSYVHLYLLRHFIQSFIRNSANLGHPSASSLWRARALRPALVHLMERDTILVPNT